MTHILSALTGRFTAGGLCRNLLLPLLLLMAQQGALLHELSHCARPEAHGQRDPQHPDADHCDLCLAFAQIASAAPAAVAVPALRADLSFHRAVPIPASDGSKERPSPRNRGPPDLT